MGTLPHSYSEKRGSQNGWAKSASKYTPWGPASVTLTTNNPIANRRFRAFIPDFNIRRRPRRRWTTVLYLACWTCVAVFGFVAIRGRWRHGSWQDSWPDHGGDGESNQGEPPSLVYKREHLQQIWDWEIQSGHYPSRRSIPRELGLTKPVVNPAVPPEGDSALIATKKPSTFLSPLVTHAIPAGPRRVYLDIASHPPNVAYPPRPVPGSIADLDIVMEHCDFSMNKYVRDCLEVLRVGAGLDNSRRFRRESLDDWRYIYMEEPTETNSLQRRLPLAGEANQLTEEFPELKKNPDFAWETQLPLPPALKYRPYTASAPCDEDHRRIFHMFWTGPFTDKPYLALLSFLYTQNTGLHLETFPADSPVCRPQFWLWINPGPAASVPNPSATRDMFDSLKTSPWAAPFLHPRFRDIIVFKLWNTTEQLDGVSEIKDEWRALQQNMFKSGGYVMNVPLQQSEAKAAEKKTDDGNSTETATQSKNDEDDDMVSRTGSTSSDTYDRLSVVLSDMARFVLCHRFGGVYLDADTIMLRDWEELWGWKGAFAYRWSRLPKYNTAVLKMHANSALGTFLFRTALKNGLDFHPMTIAKYMEEAYLEGLLLRLPDALFDAAWLNTEYYQRDRPPQPYFERFSDFFETPKESSAAPQALGFEGFFRGSFSYHFHNFWWQPFDPSRNWPDLGPQFEASERAARLAAQQKDDPLLEKPKQEDKRDLDWSAVLKRTFESYVRGEQPNMYGEWLRW